MSSPKDAKSVALVATAHVDITVVVTGEISKLLSVYEIIQDMAMASPDTLDVSTRQHPLSKKEFEITLKFEVAPAEFVEFCVFIEQLQTELWVECVSIIPSQKIANDTASFSVSPVSNIAAY